MLISNKQPERARPASRRKWRDLDVTPDLRKQIEAGHPVRPPEPRPAPVLTAITHTPQQIHYQPFNFGWLMSARDEWYRINVELPALILTDDFQRIASEHKAKEAKEILERGFVPVPDPELSVIEHAQIECLGCGRMYYLTVTGRTQADCIRQCWDRYYEGQCPTCVEDAAPDKEIRESVARRLEQERERELEELCRKGMSAEAWRRAYRYRFGYDME